MAADAKRTVNIAINIIGDAAAKFQTISSGLEKIVKPLTDIAAAITPVNIGLKTLAVNLSSIKTNIPDLAPFASSIVKLGKGDNAANLTKISVALGSFKGIKLPTGLTKFAEGIAAFNKVKEPPDLEPFVKSLKSLKGVKGISTAYLVKLADALLGFKDVKGLPQKSISSFAKGLIKLKGVKGIPVANLNKTADMLRNFTGISGLVSEAALTGLAKGLKKFKGIKSTSGKALTELASAIKTFAGIGRLPDLEKFAKSLETIGKVNTSNFTKIAAETRNLAGAMASLANVAPTIKSLGKVDKKVVVTGKQMQVLGKKVQSTSDKFKDLRKQVERYATYRLIADSIIGLKEAFTAGIAEIIDYDQALKDLQAITSATSTEVRLMGETILDVASSTKFSAKEVAEGMRTLGQAGFSASEAIKAMQGVANLATGTLSDMSESVDLVTSAMRVFSDQELTSAEAADVFANAVNKSKLTIDKIRTAFNYVAPIAKSAGVSFEDMAAAMGVLANSGLKASKIGTGLRRVLAELVDPNKKLAAAAAEAGISLEQLNPQGKNLQDVFITLGMVVTDTQSAFEIFGKRGAASVLTLIDKAEDLGKMRDTVSKSGTAAAMAAIQMEGLGVAFKNLKDRLGVLMIALGDAGITGIMRVFISMVKGAVIILTEFVSSPLGNAIITVGVFSAAIAALGTSISLLSSGLGFLLVSYTAATAATTADTAATVLNTTAKNANAIARGRAGAAGAAESASLIKGSKLLGVLTSGVRGLTMALRGLVSNPVIAVTTALVAIGVAIASTRKSSEQLIDTYDRTAISLDKNIDKVDEYREALEKLGSSEEVGVALLAKREEYLFTLAGEYPEFTKQILETNGEMDKLKVVLNDIEAAKTEEKFVKLKEGLSDLGVAAAKYRIEASGRDFIPWNNEKESVERRKTTLKEQQVILKLAESYRELKKAGKIDTIDEFWDNVEDHTKTGDYWATLNDDSAKSIRALTEAMIDQLGSSSEGIEKNIALGAFSTWDKQFKGMSDSTSGYLSDVSSVIEDATPDIRKALEGVLTETVLSNAETDQVEKKRLVDKKKLIEGEILARKEGNGKLAMSDEELFATRRQLDIDLIKLNKKLLKNNNDAVLVSLQKTATAKEKAIETAKKQEAEALDRLKTFVDKNNLTEEQANKRKEGIVFVHKKELINIENTYQKAIKAAASSLFDPKEIIKNTKLAENAIITSYKKRYADIEILRVANDISDIEAARQKRGAEATEATEIVNIWTKARNQISLVAAGSTQEDKAIKATKNAEAEKAKITVDIARETKEEQIAISDAGLEEMLRSRADAEKVYFAQQDALDAKDEESKMQVESNKLAYTMQRLSEEYLILQHNTKNKMKLAHEESGVVKEAKAKESAAFVAFEKGKTALLELQARKRTAIALREYAAAIQGVQSAETIMRNNIANAEAQGIITHEAAEKGKVQATINRYEQEYSIAVTALSKISKIASPEAWAEADAKVLAAKEAFYNKLGSFTEKYNQQVYSSLESIKDKEVEYAKVQITNEQNVAKIERTLKKKRKKAHETFRDNMLKADDDYKEKVEEIEYDLAENIEKINEDLAEKLKDLDDERIDNRKSLVAKLEGIEEDASDAIDKVRQRGMTAKQKDNDNEKIAYRKLHEARKLAKEAERTGNEELLKQSDDLYKSAGKLAENLDSANEARKGIERVASGSKENARIEERIKNLEIEKKIIEEKEKADKKVDDATKEAQHNKNLAKADFDDKITNLKLIRKKALQDAKDVAKEQKLLEKQRHTARMTSLDREMAKLREQLALAKEIAASTSSKKLDTTPKEIAASTSSKKLDTTPKESPTASATSDNPLAQSLEKTKDAIKAMEDQYASTSKTIQGEQVQIASNGYATIVENGKVMYSNLTSDQRKAMQMFGEAAKSAGTSMQGIGDSGKAEFQKIYDEYGRLVQSTEKGVDVKFNTPQDVSSITDAVPKEVTISMRTDDTFKRAENYIDSIQDKVAAIGTDGSGIRIIGPEQQAEINEYADSLGNLFSNLNTDDPIQKLQDMATVIETVAQTNTSEADKMRQSMDEYASSIEGVSTVTSLIATENGWETQITLVDELGNKVEGLSSDIQSNPFELFPDNFDAEIVSNIDNIDGALSHLKDRISEETTLEVNTEIANAKIDEALDSFFSADEAAEPIVLDVDTSNTEMSFTQVEQDYQDMMQGIMEKPIVPVIELGEEGIKEEVAKAKEEAENSDPITVPIEVSTEEVSKAVDKVATDLGALNDVEAKPKISIESEGAPVSEKVEEIKNSIEELASTEVTVQVIVDNADFEELTTKLIEVAGQHDVQVQVQVQGTDDMRTLIDWLIQLDSHNPKNIDVTADVTGNDEVVTLKQSIDALIGKIVKVIAEVTGIEQVRALKAAIDELKNKEIIITTKYVTKGSPPTENRATGGEIQGFATGGNVFRKLANRFITSGSGTKDDVPAMLTKGEFVHKVSSVDKYGKRFMEMVNAGSYPIELARKAVQNYANGGSVNFDIVPNVNTTGFVQHFATGGAVLSNMVGSLRKKLFEMLGAQLGTNVDLHVGNVNVNQEIEQHASNVTSEVGKSSIRSMADAFTSTVQGFANGGTLFDSGGSNDLLDAKKLIEDEYNKKINNATLLGNTEIAGLLQKEKDELNALAESLEKELLSLKTSYDEEVLKEKVEHEKNISDINESYNEDKAAENQDYARDVADDNLDYARTEEDYLLDSEEASAEYAKDKEDLAIDLVTQQGSIYKDLVDSYSALREAAVELNELGNIYGTVYSNGASIKGYSPTGSEEPDIDKILSLIESHFSFRSGISDPMTRNKFIEEKSLEAQKLYSDYISAIAKFSELGVSNAGRFLDNSSAEQLRVLGLTEEQLRALGDSSSSANVGTADVSMEALAALLTEQYAIREYDTLQSEYTADENDSKLDWDRYNEDFTTDTSRRDIDHNAALEDIQKGFDENILDENTSYTERLADMLSQYTEDTSSAEETAKSDALSISDNALSDIEESKGKLSDTLSDLGGELSTSLLAVSGGGQSNRVRTTEPIDDTDIQKTRALSLEELLKRISGGLHFNTGGGVPHLPDSIPGKDSILAALTPGEFVIKEPAVKFFGSGFFNALNNFRIPKFNLGGVVGTIASDFERTVASSEVKHALELSINGTQYEPLYGSSTGIDEIINSLEMAKLRS